MKRLLIALGFGFASTVALGQANISLRAATATVAGKPEVRLRWTIARGWLPAGGFRLYRAVGGAKKLVFESKPVSDAAIDALYAKTGKGRGLWSLAKTVAPTEPTLSFQPVRPASAAALFQQRKTLLGGLMAKPGPAVPKAQKSQQLSQLNATFGRGGARPAPPAAPSGLTPLAARGELHLAAFVNPAAAEVVGLGATDRDAKSGEVVTYTLHGLTAAKVESAQPVATLSNFAVGQDAPPPAPTGLAAFQDDEEVSLRWDRIPAATEASLLHASFRIYRLDPGKSAPTLRTSKPLVIMALDGDLEPVAFFVDKLEVPGTHTYQVSLVDGFGRESARTPLSFTAVDWRRPDPPPLAGASLGSLVRRFQIPGRVKSGGRIEPTAGLTPTVVWVPPTDARKLPIKYHIYRTDLDQAAAAPVRITANPIDGTSVPLQTPAEFESAVTDLLGPDYLAKLQADLIAAESAPPGPNRAKNIAKASAKVDALVKALRARLAASGVRKFEDAGAGKDHRFAYSIVALYVMNGLESEEAAAGIVGIPDRTPPPAVTGGAGLFKPAPPRPLAFKIAPTKLSRTAYVGPRIKADKAAPRAAAAKSLGRTFAGLTFAPRKPLKLALPAKDHGGSVELTWTGFPNLKDVRYLVRRKLGSERFADVGISAPNQAKFVDPVPRSRSRTYDYEVTPVTRWNVRGPAATFAVSVPSTVSPEPVNLLSVRPGPSEGSVEIRFETLPVDQSVTSYQVLLNGQVVKTVAASEAANGLLTAIDAGRALGAPLRYSVLGVAGALKSPPSAELTVTLKKLSTAAPTGLAGQTTPKGVQLSWTAAPGATSYAIRRRVGAAGPWAVVAAKVVGVAYLDASAVPGVAYSYAVVAVDAAGNVSPPATCSATG